MEKRMGLKLSRSQNVQRHEIKFIICIAFKIFSEGISIISSGCLPDILQGWDCSNKSKTGVSCIAYSGILVFVKSSSWSSSSHKSFCEPCWKLWKCSGLGVDSSSHKEQFRLIELRRIWGYGCLADRFGSLSDQLPSQPLRKQSQFLLPQMERLSVIHKKCFAHFGYLGGSFQKPHSLANLQEKPEGWEEI